jgi:HTH-type transcriptional regulator, competence development regulator
MAQSTLGEVLQFLREQRGLSLRELARLADVDHAYIYRLESGDKESPSEEVLTKLLRALKADKRESDIVKFAAEHSQTDSGFVIFALKRADIGYDLFAASAAAVFRGAARPEYEKLVARVRRILESEKDDG